MLNKSRTELFVGSSRFKEVGAGEGSFGWCTPGAMVGLGIADANGDTAG